MDDTNTANSSSAAAVASASTKTVGAAPPATKSSSYVKLLIKASNQQHDDQIIESDLLWTVKRLKSHLAVVYPSKPPAADQKLIYSGQLLNDSLQLKDVIRSYKDVYTHNHIIHLVYTPKNLPPITPIPTNLNKSKPALSTTGVSNMSSEDGLRQRHTNAHPVHMSSGSMQPQSPQVLPEQMTYYSQYLPQTVLTNGGVSYPPMTIPGYGQYNMQALAMQQAAMYSWMQQVYSQYMERVSNTVNGVTSDATTAGVAGSTLPPFSTFPQYPFLPQFPQTVISPAAQASSLAATSAATELQAPPQHPELPAQQQPAQAAAPRFPNMPQDEPDNRDWLDNIFSIIRLALFLTILYFNSSPLRCLAVVIIAGGIYLYHIGVFRLRHERNNNNLNRNNNAVQNAAVDQIRQGVDQQQQHQPELENEQQENNPIENNGDNNDPAASVGGNNDQQQATATNSDNIDSPDNAANNNNESMISTLRTFVLTFFTSLLPETPAL